MVKHIALIVDDEPDICELIELTLSRMGITSMIAENITKAKNLLNENNFSLCLTDMRLPDGNGIELVEYIHHNAFDTPVAVITAHGNMESAIFALKKGAFDFVSKPVDLQVLRNLVNIALKQSKKNSEPNIAAVLTLLGESKGIKQIRTTITKLSRSQAPVYISGESGTGKELVARMIHEQGARSDKNFIPVNCGAIPDQLMESEFFGYKKGSFTGASTDKVGLFQAAHGGTLFLDEVADLPLAMQVKMLRAIQEKSIRPLGSQKETPIDVRILSATHKDLSALVKEGKFRQDLFYRINVIEMHVPSLRERQEDIPLLVNHILSRLTAQNNSSTYLLSPDALNMLVSHNFPGNVRELENILERAVTLCESNIINANDLMLPVMGRETAELPSYDINERSLEPYLDSIEKDAIIKALEQSRYNKTAAAKLLGITFRALRYKLKKLGLEY